MLYFLGQMHNKDRGRLERGQVAFDIKAIHIVEAGIASTLSNSSDGSAPQQLMDSCSMAAVPLYVVPLEAVFLQTSKPVPLNSLGQCNDLQHLQTDLQQLLQVNVIQTA